MSTLFPTKPFSVTKKTGNYTLPRDRFAYIQPISATLTESLGTISSQTRNGPFLKANGEFLPVPISISVSFTTTQARSLTYTNIFGQLEFGYVSVTTNNANDITGSINSSIASVINATATDTNTSQSSGEAGGSLSSISASTTGAANFSMRATVRTKGDAFWLPPGTVIETSGVVEYMLTEYIA